MKWNLTRTQYMADFYIVPIYIFAALLTLIIRSDFPSYWGVYPVLGWMIWTLTEYIIHRAGFHFYYKYDHARHHVKPKAWIGITPWVSTSLLAVVWVGCWILTGNLNIGSLIFIGFCLGYYSYIGIHYLIHHSTTSIINKLRLHHDLHHRNPQINYGVSVRFWDVIFKTIKSTKKA